MALRTSLLPPDALHCAHLCNTRCFALCSSLQHTMLCIVRISATHGALHCAHLCNTRCFALCTSLQHTVLCIVHISATHGALHCAHLCNTRCFALCTSLQHTVLCIVHISATHGAVHCAHLCSTRYIGGKARYPKRYLNTHDDGMKHKIGDLVNEKYLTLRKDPITNLLFKSFVSFNQPIANFFQRLVVRIAVVKIQAFK